LAHVLRPLQRLFSPADYPDLLVGLGTPDDAAVYRLDGERALIFTIDFFTPIVDDPFDYGAIAAANALSDIWAMGGQPLLALNLVAFPSDLSPYVLTQVTRGMAETVRSAGAAIAGGHSIKDSEPKVGLCVAGTAHPDHLLTKDGARDGDLLVLTKPLGSGVITTAAKIDCADASHVDAAIRWMKHLNRRASEVAVSVGVCGGTDITGFGLLGHAWEMAEASHVGLQIELSQVPFMEGAAIYASQGIMPGGSGSNRDAYEPHVHFANRLPEGESMLLSDAQTSGGLLLSVPKRELASFEARMTGLDEPYWIIGQVIGGHNSIEVI
jgi:selenide,water dikinase